ncbi:MAG: hypothetical protein GEU86_22775 [Actinophytocola sp.]|nr:hypothetical protein [Actinophytocola sp.]
MRLGCARMWNRTHRGLASALAFLLALAVIAVPANVQASPDSADTHSDLTLLDERQIDDRLVELTFQTAALREPTHIRVLLPSKYDPGKRYPVLYLLHGGGGDHRDWTDKGEAAVATANLPLIVVMPGVGPACGRTGTTTAHSGHRSTRPTTSASSSRGSTRTTPRFLGGAAALSQGCPWVGSARSPTPLATRTCSSRLRASPAPSTLTSYPSSTAAARPS